MSFATKLKELRRQYELTQNEMSVKLNMQQSTYSRYETGKTIPAADIVSRIASEFNVSIDWLIKDDEDIEECTSENEDTGNSIENDELYDYVMPGKVMEVIASQQRTLELLVRIIAEK